MDAWGGELDLDLRSPVFLVLNNILSGFVSFKALNFTLALANFSVICYYSRAVNRRATAVIMIYLLSSFSFIMFTNELLKESVALLFQNIALILYLRKKMNGALIFLTLSCLAHTFNVAFIMIFLLYMHINNSKALLVILGLFFAKNSLINLLIESDYSSLFLVYFNESENSYIYQQIQWFVLIIGAMIAIHMQKNNKNVCASNNEVLRAALFSVITLALLSFDVPELARRLIYKSELLIAPLIIISVVQTRNRMILLLGTFLFSVVILQHPSIEKIVNYG
jgi:hypothetical protein